MTKLVVDVNEIVISKHASQRLKEREGLKKSAQLRNAKNAVLKGTPHGETKGRLKKFLTGMLLSESSHKGTHAYVYNNCVYLFNKNVLVTVIQVPSNLHKLVNA